MTPPNQDKSKVDAEGWILLDLATGASTYFEKFSDCFPNLNGPLDVRVGDKYKERPKEQLP